MRIMILGFLVLTFDCMANTYGPASTSNYAASEKSQIVMDALWEQLDWPKKDHVAPSKKEQSKPKFVDPTPKPEPTISPDPTISPTPAPQKLSRGESKVQEQLRKNRERLKRLRERQKTEQQVVKDETPTPFDRESFNKKSLADLRNDGLRDLKEKRDTGLKSFQEQVKATYAHWKRKRQEFLGNLKSYQENQFDLSTVGSTGPVVSRNKLVRSVRTPIRNEYHIVPGALDVPIRDQGRRPTCSAFAGIRGIETLLEGNDVSRDLSEQYLYWSSKPQCRQFPCTKRGSWIRSGYDFSQKATSPDIPTESNCPYKTTSRAGNETQVPLTPGCQNGSVKVTKFESLETLDDVVTALNDNKPVVAGFKLSANFYKTEGLVTFQDSLEKGQVDAHASGHAVLIVGHMKLPPQFSLEGKICFIIANSWGEGWGKGGFGCLTERWARTYRIRNPFVAVSGLRVQ